MISGLLAINNKQAQPEQTGPLSEPANYPALRKIFGVPEPKALPDPNAKAKKLTAQIMSAKPTKQKQYVYSAEYPDVGQVEITADSPLSEEEINGYLDGGYESALTHMARLIPGPRRDISTISPQERARLAKAMALTQQPAAVVSQVGKSVNTWNDLIDAFESYRGGIKAGNKVPTFIDANGNEVASRPIVARAMALLGAPGAHKNVDSPEFLAGMKFALDHGQRGAEEGLTPRAMAMGEKAGFWGNTPTQKQRLKTVVEHNPDIAQLSPGAMAFRAVTQAATRPVSSIAELMDSRPTQDLPEWEKAGRGIGDLAASILAFQAGGQAAGLLGKAAGGATALGKLAGAGKYLARPASSIAEAVGATPGALTGAADMLANVAGFQAPFALEAAQKERNAQLTPTNTQAPSLAQGFVKNLGQNLAGMADVGMLADPNVPISEKILQGANLALLGAGAAGIAGAGVDALKAKSFRDLVDHTKAWIPEVKDASFKDTDMPVRTALEVAKIHNTASAIRDPYARQTFIDEQTAQLRTRVKGMIPERPVAPKAENIVTKSGEAVAAPTSDGIARPVDKVPTEVRVPEVEQALKTPPAGTLTVDTDGTVYHVDGTTETGNIHLTPQREGLRPIVITPEEYGLNWSHAEVPDASQANAALIKHILNAQDRVERGVLDPADAELRQRAAYDSINRLMQDETVTSGEPNGKVQTPEENQQVPQQAVAPVAPEAREVQQVSPDGQLALFQRQNPTGTAVMPEVPQETPRGREGITQSLGDLNAQGVLSPADHATAQRFVDSLPDDALNGLGLVSGDMGTGVKGGYDPTQRVIAISKELAATDPDGAAFTVAHEIGHHIEQFVPEKIGLRKQFLAELERGFKSTEGLENYPELQGKSFQQIVGNKQATDLAFAEWFANKVAKNGLANVAAEDLPKFQKALRNAASFTRGVVEWYARGGQFDHAAKLMRRLILDPMSPDGSFENVIRYQREHADPAYGIEQLHEAGTIFVKTAKNLDLNNEKSCDAYFPKFKAQMEGLLGEGVLSTPQMETLYCGAREAAKAINGPLSIDTFSAKNASIIQEFRDAGIEPPKSVRHWAAVEDQAQAEINRYAKAHPGTNLCQEIMRVVNDPKAAVPQSISRFLSKRRSGECILSDVGECILLYGRRESAAYRDACVATVNDAIIRKQSAEGPSQKAYFDEQIRSAQSEMKRYETEIGKNQTALESGGTEIGRALAFRKNAIDAMFRQADRLLDEAKARAGRKLDPSEEKRGNDIASETDRTATGLEADNTLKSIREGRKSLEGKTKGKPTPKEQAVFDLFKLYEDELERITSGLKEAKGDNAKIAELSRDYHICVRELMKGSEYGADIFTGKKSPQELRKEPGGEPKSWGISGVPENPFVETIRNAWQNVRDQFQLEQPQDTTAREIARNERRIAELQAEIETGNFTGPDSVTEADYSNVKNGKVNAELEALRAERARLTKIRAAAREEQDIMSRLETGQYVKQAVLHRPSPDPEVRAWQERLRNARNLGKQYLAGMEHQSIFDFIRHATHALIFTNPVNRIQDWASNEVHRIAEQNVAARAADWAFDRMLFPKEFERTGSVFDTSPFGAAHIDTVFDTTKAMWNKEVFRHAFQEVVNNSGPLGEKFQDGGASNAASMIKGDSPEAAARREWVRKYIDTPLGVLERAPAVTDAQFVEAYQSGIYRGLCRARAAFEETQARKHGHEFDYHQRLEELYANKDGIMDQAVEVAQAEALENVYTARGAADTVLENIFNGRAIEENYKKMGWPDDRAKAAAGAYRLTMEFFVGRFMKIFTKIFGYGTDFAWGGLKAAKLAYDVKVSGEPFTLQQRRRVSQLVRRNLTGVAMMYAADALAKQWLNNWGTYNKDLGQFDYGQVGIGRMRTDWDQLGGPFNVFFWELSRRKIATMLEKGEITEDVAKKMLGKASFQYALKQPVFTGTQRFLDVLMGDRQDAWPKLIGAALRNAFIPGALRGYASQTDELDNNIKLRYTADRKGNPLKTISNELQAGIPGGLGVPSREDLPLSKAGAAFPGLTKEQQLEFKRLEYTPTDVRPRSTSTNTEADWDRVVSKKLVEQSDELRQKLVPQYVTAALSDPDYKGLPDKTGTGMTKRKMLSRYVQSAESLSLAATALGLDDSTVQAYAKYGATLPNVAWQKLNDKESDAQFAMRKARAKAIISNFASNLDTAVNATKQQAIDKALHVNYGPAVVSQLINQSISMALQTAFSKERGLNKAATPVEEYALRALRSATKKSVTGGLLSGASKAGALK